MNAPADETDPDASVFKPENYRGVAIQQAVAGRIGAPPGRPFYQFSCVVYGRRRARTSLVELHRAIDEALDS
jgi:hypothetical protein